MRRMTGILAGVFLLLGLAALLYHPLSSWAAQHHMKGEIAEFEQALEREGVQPSQGEAPSTNEYQNLLEEMQTYNERLYESGQSGLTDAWSYEQAAFDLTSYGLSTEVMGVLRIPAMEQELPVYLGATQENMARGVAVLGQTSMPVGGMNTNCVIVGHRGYGGTAFFREIEALQPGDPVYLTTYWGTKPYQVERTAIILPDQIDAVLIQEGRELLTLVTCHPYTVATHRYVVYCAAVEDGSSHQASTPAEPDGTHSQDGAQTGHSLSQRRIQLEQWLPFLAIPLIVVSIPVVIWPKRKKKRGLERGKD